MANKDDQIYDLVIVGAGAAGLSAAIYASRRELRTAVVSQDIGGQAATTPDIENYPGVGFSDGLDLMNKFKAQSEKFGAEFRIETVREVKKNKDELFEVRTNTFTLKSKTVLLAFGLSHKHLDIPGEEKLCGKGVSYCATCDAPLYKNKEVVVVGGGSSAADAAILLSKIAKHVTLVNRSEEFRAEAVLLKKVQEAKNIEVVLDATPKEIHGDQCVTHFVATGNKDKKDVEIPCDGVFVEIGFTVKADWIKGLVETDERRQIIISPNCETSTEGIFAAGDVTNISFKQIVVSAGEGAKAALQIYQYLLKKEGKRGAFIDWGTKSK